MNTYHQIIQLVNEVSAMHQELQQLRTSNAALRAERDIMRHLLSEAHSTMLVDYSPSGNWATETQEVLK